MYGHIVVEKEGGRVMVDRPGGLEIRQGQTVKAGQRIGRVGMTGRTTGPHLHWGMKYQGLWVDPALVLKAMQAQ
jgi:murein DD-endopeptidase MepM/ murein hydrolase activator NlpD